MVYLATFNYSSSFLKNKIRSFLQGDFSNVFILDKSNLNKSFRSIDCIDNLLPDDHFMFRDPWIIYNNLQNKGDVSGEHLIDLYNEKTFDELNKFIFRLAESNTWTICPWGGTANYMAFLFITTRRELLEKFTKSFGSNVVAFQDGHHSCDMLISSYSVNSRVENHINAIIYREDMQMIGYRAWDACNPYNNSLHLTYKEYDEEKYLLDMELWYEREFEVLSSFSPFGKGEDPYLEDTSYSIYKINDIVTFNYFCRSELDDFPSIITVPSTAKMENLPELISEIDSIKSFSDLCHLPRILCFSEWVYAIGRGHIDDSYSLFASNQNELMRNFIKSPICPDSKEFKVVSFF